MEYKKFGDQFYIRLDHGDEIMSSITNFCHENSIHLAEVSGIGGCSIATAGVFDSGNKDYKTETVNKLLEMISLNGNITEVGGKPFLHAHAVFAYKDETGNTKLLAGHLLNAVIGLTGEIVLTPSEGNIGREYNESLGIKTWKF